MKARKAVKAAILIKEAINLLQQEEGYEETVKSLRWKVAVIERREFGLSPDFASGTNILK
jgi:hypothetical protein